MPRCEWKVNAEVVKDYLTSKIYVDSEIAFIRELVLNAIASHIATNIKAPIRVFLSPRKIIITDYGLGMTKDEFKNVFMWLGRSLNANIEGVQGKFGIGAKALLAVIKQTGYANIVTKSRKTNEAFHVKLTLNGAILHEISPHRTHYGTTIEIYPENNLNIKRLYQYLVHSFKFTRVPIEIVTPKETTIIQFETAKLLERTKYYEIHELPLQEPPTIYLAVGDLTVESEPSPAPKSYLVRTLIEDEVSVKIHPNIETTLPTPTPSRDAYRNAENFLSIIKYYILIKYYLPEILKNPFKATERDRSCLENIANYSSSILKSILPKQLKERITLLTEPIIKLYGTENKTVSLLEVITNKDIRIDYYTTTPIKSIYAEEFATRGLCIAKIPNNPLLKYYFKLLNVKPLNKLPKPSYNVLTVYCDKKVPRCMSEPEVISKLKSHPVVIQIKNHNEVGEYPLSSTILLKGHSPLLKQILGELYIENPCGDNLTIVTDGYDVYYLKDIPKDAILVNSWRYIPILPLLKKLLGKPVYYIYYEPLPITRKIQNDLIENVLSEHRLYNEAVNVLNDITLEAIHNDIYEILGIEKTLPLGALEKLALEKLEPPKVRLGRIPLSQILNISTSVVLDQPIAIHPLSLHYARIIEPIGFWTHVIIENWNQIPNTVRNEIIEYMEPIKDKIKDVYPDFYKHYLK